MDLWRLEDMPGPQGYAAWPSELNARWYVNRIIQMHPEYGLTYEGRH